MAGESLRALTDDERTWAEEALGEPVRDAELVYLRDDRRTTRIVGRSGLVSFLKVAPGLRAERERLEWLRDRLPVPEVRGFEEGSAVDRLLTTALAGEDLTTGRQLADPGRVVELLAAALRRIHALDPSSCPFRESNGDQGVVVHGDACLPNFLVVDGNLSGYIDLGACRVGPATIDLEAALWSLQHNLGDGFGRVFLERYGWSSSDPETVASLVEAYEKRR